LYAKNYDYWFQFQFLQVIEDKIGDTLMRHGVSFQLCKQFDFKDCYDLLLWCHKT